MPPCRISAGIGTNLTSGLVGCAPPAVPDLAPVSFVCRMTEVEGQAAVKLSDNHTQAAGAPGEIAHDREAFGTAGLATTPVTA